MASLTVSPTTFIPVSPAVPTPMEVQVVQFGVEIPNRVFVGGCPYNMTEKELGDFFKTFGPIKDTKIVFDKATGKSLGYGFVTYICEADAINVYSKGSIYYKEKKLNVSKAVRKQGGQFVRPNQEFVNGSIMPLTNSYYMSQDGLWMQAPAHTQPVKPYYTVYVGPGGQGQPGLAGVGQPGMTYSVQNPTLAPMGGSYMVPTLQALPTSTESVPIQEITSSEPDSEKPEEPFQGVDLNRLFERRHSAGRKAHNYKHQPEQYIITSPGLLPTPTYVSHLY